MPKPIRETPQAGSESPAAGEHPTREEIEERAYQIYIESGCAVGNEMENWLRAERELQEKFSKKGGKAKATAV